MKTTNKLNSLSPDSHKVKINRLPKKLKLLILILIIPFLAGKWSSAENFNVEENKIVYQGNKIIPKHILEEAKVALSFYPELEDVEIEFRYKNNIKNAFMQAQPKIANVFKGKKDRSYYVFMSSKFLVEDEVFSMAEVPSEVIIGWLGHELGHIMDYRNKTTLELAKFGARYITSEDFIKKAERKADTYAIDYGLGHFIFATKDFILNHSQLTDSYKERKARLYFSPAEILAMVNNLEEELKDELENELEEIEEEET